VIEGVFMRKLKGVAGTVIALLAMADVAGAADGLSAMPGRATWTGFYAGANAGYAFGSDDVTLNEVDASGAPVNNAAVSAVGSPSFSPAGFIGGAQAGYNYQLGQIVFGFEGDFQYLGLRGALGIVSTFPTTRSTTPVPFNVNTQVSTNWMATARPRIGYAFNRNLMAYLTGGLAVADDRFSQTAALASGYTVSSSSVNRIGGVVGAGMEWALDERWSAKAEYLYADFGKATTLGSLKPSFAGFGWNNSYQLTTSVARIGVNYKFW
jgi:outer membrane immunogenic protein